MCTCNLCFEEKYYFSSERLLYITFACFCNIFINKHLLIGRKNIFKRKERNKVNFCLLFDLFVFASFHSPVHSYISVEN